MSTTIMEHQLPFELTPNNLTYIAGAALVVLFLVQKIRSRRFSTYNALPGPPSISWWLGNESQIWHRVVCKFTLPWGKVYGHTYKTKGSIASPRRMVTSDPLACGTILRKTDLFDRAIAEQVIFNRFAGSGILATAPKDHSRHRRMIMPSFASARLTHYIPTFQQYTCALKEHWKTKLADTGAAYLDRNGFEDCAAVVTDGFCAVAFGYETRLVETLGRGKDPVIAALNILLIKQFVDPPPAALFVKDLLGIVPIWIQNLLEAILPIENIKETQKNSAVVGVFAEEIIDLRTKDFERGDSNTSKDLITTLIRSNLVESNPAKRLSREELVGQVKTFITAGTDTTSGAASWMAFRLATNPDAQAKLRQEVQEARAAVGGRDLDMAELEKLPYLNACVNETFRMDPATPTRDRTAIKDAVLPLSEPVTLQDGTKVSEIFVPAWTNITVDITSYNRRADLWGPEPEVWKPERWLEADYFVGQKGKNLPGIHQHLLTFADGPRQCPGYKLAAAVLQSMFSSVIDEFELSLIPGYSPEDVCRTASIVMGPVIDNNFQEYNVPIRVTPING